MASSNTTPMLALPSAGYGQGASWRKNEDLIDALPYIDTMTPELKKQVGWNSLEVLQVHIQGIAELLSKVPSICTAMLRHSSYGMHNPHTAVRCSCARPVPQAWFSHVTRLHPPACSHLSNTSSPPVALSHEQGSQRHQPRLVHAQCTQPAYADLQGSGVLGTRCGQDQAGSAPLHVWTSDTHTHTPSQECT